jgi:hypothetical protein
VDFKREGGAQMLDSDCNKYKKKKEANPPTSILFIDYENP